jgi:hypothetical protein
MAYAARIHALDGHQKLMVHTARDNADNDLLLQAEEAANTWWGIVIFERYVSPGMLGKSSMQMKAKPVLVIGSSSAKWQSSTNRWLPSFQVEMRDCRSNPKSSTGLTF